MFNHKSLVEKAAEVCNIPMIAMVLFDSCHPLSHLNDLNIFSQGSPPHLLDSRHGRCLRGLARWQAPLGAGRVIYKGGR